jgi:glycosyltransferase involved in cell wall biosynthesis
MFTNTYAPLVGGIEKSISTFTQDFREMGHNTLVVTPTFEGAEKSDEQTLRLPAIKKIQGSKFSWPLPTAGALDQRLDEFAPSLIHAHQPFLMGDTALRESRKRGRPLVFTNHTLYERYVSMFNMESEAVERLAVTLPVEYANLCDLVIAPTRSIAEVIRERGVQKPVEVAPTGIETQFFADGGRQDFRERYGVPKDAFAVGHLGRLVPAKNMNFLAESVSAFLQNNEKAVFLLVGDGESVKEMRRIFRLAGVNDRVIFVGELAGKAVADAYAAMDLFIFTSKTDTQGIVLIEAFSAGLPVIALDAPGARDIVRDQEDGHLLPMSCSMRDFAQAIQTAYDDAELRRRWSENCRERAKTYDRGVCAKRMITIYETLLAEWRHTHPATNLNAWDQMQEGLLAEWHLLEEKVAVAAATFFDMNVREEEENSSQGKEQAS